jgi:hypothetical protein
MGAEQERWLLLEEQEGLAKAQEEAAKNPFFKKVYESQREYASKVVPAKRFMFPPYSFAANYYWPEEKKPAAKAQATADGRRARRVRRNCGHAMAPSALSRRW